MSPSLIAMRDEALYKPDLTGLIADAQGVYHDLTKGAFDAFSMKHPHEVIEDISDKLLNQPLFEGIKGIAEEAGIDLSKFGELDPAGVAATLAAWLGGKVKGIAVAGVSEGAALLSGAEIATGGAAAVGLAVEMALEWATKSFTRDNQQSYLQGDWVTVDHGQKTVKAVDRALDFAMGAMFEDAPDLSEVHVLARVDDFHVGFYVSNGEEASTVAVFDILDGTVQRHHSRDVALLPQSNRAGLDNDPVASKIRELYFMKRDHVRFGATVQTDPGTEVIYDGELFNIVHTDGDVALIEDKGGERKHVGLVSLERSRQERVGPTHIYKQGIPKAASDFVATAGGFGTGDWVWYEVGNELWELSVVHIINGPNAVVYCTAAGTRRVLAIGQIRVASRDDADLFNRVRVFALFKAAAVAGEEYNTQRLAIPEKWSPLVLRKDPPARREARVAATQPSFRLNQTEASVVTGRTAAEVDEAVEIQNLHGGYGGEDVYEAVAVNEAECRRRLMLDGHDSSLCRPTPRGVDERPGDKTVERPTPSGAVGAASGIPFAAIGIGALWVAYYFWLK